MAELDPERPFKNRRKKMNKSQKHTCKGCEKEIDFTQCILESEA